MPLATLGTVNWTLVSDHDWMAAAVAPNKTLTVVAPKPFPEMVTLRPGWPTIGPIEPTSGAGTEQTDCHTATVCAGKVKLTTGLLPPLPLFTVMPKPPKSPTR